MMGMERMNTKMTMRAMYPTLMSALVECYLVTVREMRALRFYDELSLDMKVTDGIDLLLEININGLVIK